TVRLSGEVASEAGRLVVLPEERGLAVVFQDLALWPHLSVAGNLAFGLQSRGATARDREARIQSTPWRGGRPGQERHHPDPPRRQGRLPGGDGRRVAFARARARARRVVPPDEPLSNLDVGLKRELLSVFRDLLKERRTTALYVTHDLREAAALGDRIAVMEQGRIVQEGTLESLRASPSSSFVRELLDDFASAS